MKYRNKPRVWFSVAYIYFTVNEIAGQFQHYKRCMTNMVDTINDVIVFKNEGNQTVSFIFI